jgi:3-oxoacyl-[acyl-carrier protein] reductase
MLKDRVVLMTGAGRGLGKPMTLALLKEGARVVLSSTDPQSLAETIAEAGVGPDRAVAVVANIAEPGECERLAKEAVAAFGQVDILVNNAGIGSDAVRPDYLNNPYRFWEVEPETFDLFFKVNSTAPYRLAALLAPAMIKRGWGRIVSNTTSLDTMLRVPLYGGSKAALEAHTAIMANDLAGTGVTANVLVPGGAAVSRMTENLGVAAEMMIPAEMMAPPMVFLASDASNAVTGKRFIARRWDPALPVAQAAELAGDPIAWTGYGQQGIQPEAAK